MSATATTSRPATRAKSKPKGKSKPKPKARTKTKAERAEINRQNSLRSTGPRTPFGKLRSSQNSVTHGLTARSGLLIGEDPDEFEALKQMMIGRFKPYNDAELTVVERIAGDIWLSDRAAQSAGKRLAERLRHGPLEQAKKEKDEAIELGDSAVLASGISASLHHDGPRSAS